MILHALIDTNGNVIRLDPISSPDKSLTLAAMAAVRQWKYKPYLLHGEPTEIDTQISINFEL